jgi:hypothetical protein
LSLPLYLGLNVGLQPHEKKAAPKAPPHLPKAGAKRQIIAFAFAVAFYSLPTITPPASRSASTASSATICRRNCIVFHKANKKIPANIAPHAAILSAHR